MQRIKQSLLAIALCIAFGQVMADEVLDRAKGLIDSRKADVAYQLLAQLEPQRAGQPDFDYLLGLAALDSGRGNEAVFALERVLAVNPDHPQARAEIARAYFELGERETAKQEFNNVLKKAPPASVETTIRRFLGAIEEIEAAARTKVTGYLEALLGLDSNVKGATNDKTIAVAGIPIPTPGGNASSDAYMTFTGGINIKHALTSEWAVTGGASFSLRSHFNVGDNWGRADATALIGNNPSEVQSDDLFDQKSLDGTVGISYTEGVDSYSLSYMHQSFFVDHGRFRDAKGWMGQWQHTIDKASQLTLYGQRIEMSFPGSDSQDVIRSAVGGGYAHAFDMRYSPVIFVGGFLGDESSNSRQSGNGAVNQQFYGIRGGGQISLNKDWSLFATASYENRVYGLPLNDPREDHQFDISAGAVYAYGKNWNIKPQYAYTRNDSNLGISDYERHVLSVAMRRNF